MKSVNSEQLSAVITSLRNNKLRDHELLEQMAQAIADSDEAAQIVCHFAHHTYDGTDVHDCVTAALIAGIIIGQQMGGTNETAN